MTSCRRCHQPNWSQYMLEVCLYFWRKWFRNLKYSSNILIFFLHVANVIFLDLSKNDLMHWRRTRYRAELHSLSISNHRWVHDMVSSAFLNVLHHYVGSNLLKFLYLLRVELMLLSRHLSRICLLNLLHTSLEINEVFHFSLDVYTKNMVNWSKVNHLEITL